MNNKYLKKELESENNLNFNKNIIPLNDLNKIVFFEKDILSENFDYFKDIKFRFYPKSQKLYDIYFGIIQILKYYCDWKLEYYPIVACWIIGTYFHEKMITYPYLYFNASKESGKSRSVRLITYLCGGEMLNSPTEAVLFRTKGCLGIDEFEKASRKGNENLIELLNSSYKKGVKVKRMKKVKTEKGEEQQVETFEVFRPIILANIWGMDPVLEDRTLPLYLEKTTRDDIGNLLEIWEFDEIISNLMKELKEECSLCSVVSFQNIYLDWNKYITTNYNTTRTNNYTKLHLFEKIKNSELKGRMLELSFPLLIIADMLDDPRAEDNQETVVDELISSLRQISIEKNQENFLNNKDIIFLDWVSQQPTPTNFKSVKEITNDFRQSMSINEDWVNEKWVGRAINRMLLSKKKDRDNRGVKYILNIEKAIEKMKVYQ